jgi:hypothetical protein
MAQRRITPRRDDPRPGGDATYFPRFPASWLDRFQAWVERLPISTWAFYLFAALGLSLLMHVLRWLDGSLPPGSLEVNQLTLGIFPVYFFALIHYLNSAAHRALANYRPLLDLKEPGYASLEYTLTRMPRRIGLLAFALGAFLSAASFLFSPESWGVEPSFPYVSRGAIFIGTFTMQIAATYWIFQVIRQARTIDRIHQSTKRLNIFRRDPVYAFSSLTLRSSLGLLLPVYTYLFLAYSLRVTATPSAFNAAAMGVAVALSLAIFFLPLSRMHGRLAAEKHLLLLDADQRYSLLVDRFNRQVDKGRFTDLDSTGRAIAALTAQREAVAKISTWPWRAETLRALLSTVAAPIILYLASRLLGRLFGV